MKTLRSLLTATAVATLTLCSGIAQEAPRALNINQLSNIAKGLELNAEQTKGWESLEKAGRAELAKSRDEMAALRAKGLNGTSDEMKAVFTALQSVNKETESAFVALLNDDQAASFTESRNKLTTGKRKPLNAKPGLLKASPAKKPDPSK